MNNPLVAVGIGNTTISFGLIELSGAGALGAGSPGDPASITSAWPWSQLLTVETAGFDPAEVAAHFPAPAAWRVASVHRPSEQKLAAWVGNSNAANNYQNLATADLPIKVCLDHPERVGLDRLAAAVAVNQLRDPHQPAIIVDAGTAITVDLVNPSGHFMGGAILPGLRLVSQALAAKTDQLPLVDPQFYQSPPPPLGKATAGAILSGLFWGSVGAIRELVARIGAEAGGQPRVFLTGGDAELLTPYITPDALFVRDLVLRGIVTAGPS